MCRIQATSRVAQGKRERKQRKGGLNGVDDVDGPGSREIERVRIKATSDTIYTRSAVHYSMEMEQHVVYQ